MQRFFHKPIRAGFAMPVSAALASSFLACSRETASRKGAASYVVIAKSLYTE